MSRKGQWGKVEDEVEGEDLGERMETSKRLRHVHFCWVVKREAIELVCRRNSVWPKGTRSYIVALRYGFTYTSSSQDLHQGEQGQNREFRL